MVVQSAAAVRVSDSVDETAAVQTVDSVDAAAVVWAADSADAAAYSQDSAAVSEAGDTSDAAVSDTQRVLQLADSLPDKEDLCAMTEEERAAVSQQIAQLGEAYSQLSEEEQETVDMSHAAEISALLDAMSAGMRFAFASSVNPLYEDIITEDDLAEAPAAVMAYDSGIVWENISDASVEIRDNLVQRTEVFSVLYKFTEAKDAHSYDSSGEVVYEYAAAAHEMFELAFAHTGSPVYGDYLSYQYGGWKAGISISGTSGSSDRTAKYTFTVTYYTDYEQEQAVESRVNEVLAEIVSDSMSDYEKIKAVYDYICDNVAYDYANLGNTDYKLQYTAYGALIDGRAVCQGYSALFYRSMLELGIDCRIISGLGNGGAHAWNIVKLGNYYYNVDVTWDSNYSDTDAYKYFLKSDADFGAHERDTDKFGSDFEAQYNISGTSYTLPEDTDEAEAVACVELSDGTVTEYTNLRTAFANASGGTVRLLKNTKVTAMQNSSLMSVYGVYLSGGDYTLDLNGKSLNVISVIPSISGYSSGLFVLDGASLAITDSSADKTGIIALGSSINCPAVINDLGRSSGQTVSLDGVTVFNGGGYAVKASAQSLLNISESIVTGGLQLSGSSCGEITLSTIDGRENIALDAEGSCSLNISASRFTSGENSAVRFAASSLSESAFVSGECEFVTESENYYGLECTGGSLTVYSGTFSSPAAENGLYVGSAAKVSLRGGSYSGITAESGAVKDILCVGYVYSQNGEVVTDVSSGSIIGVDVILHSEHYTSNNCLSAAVCDVCGYEYADRGPHSFDENGVCTVCGEYEYGAEGDIAGYSLSLNGNIGVNFFMELDESVLSDSGAYMQFTLPDGNVSEIPVSDAELRNLNGKDYYVFPCEVAAKEMTADITAQIVFSDGSRGEEFVFTVKQYADHILEHSDENEEYAKAAELVKTMLNYGAKAQQYFEYNTQLLANEGLTDEEKSVEAVTAEMLEAYKNTDIQQNDLAVFEGANLSLVSQTTLRLYFTVDESKADSVVYSCGGETLEPVKHGNYYYVEITDISADNLDTEYVITLSDGTDTLNVSYSVLAYCYNVLSRPVSAARTQELKDLLAALYLYNVQADKFTA